jgi:diguanylate cyclase
MTSRDHAYTIKTAELALERIRALSLPADPPGYELWYTYTTGRNERLNERINKALAQHGTLSLDELDQISDEFLISSRMRAQLDSANTKISTEINSVVEMLGELVLSTSEGRHDCADASRQLASSTDGDVVRSIADTLIASLRKIEVQQATLEQRLAASRQELEAVHQALAAMEIEASLDPVTGLNTRRHFNIAIEQAMKDAERDGKPVSLLMIDIDHFKRFNDEFGHLMGDSVLSLVGAILKQSVKGQDVAARFGGEEFAIILPDTSLKNACTLAEQLRQKIMNRELKVRSSGLELGALTISVGVASSRPGERPRTLIERADACLYEAKIAGRNCTRSEDAEPAGSDAASLAQAPWRRRRWR